MKTIRNLILTLIALASAALAAWFIFRPSDNAPVTVRPGVVTDVRQMVRLCAVDIYSEIPVIDTVNNKVIMAIQKQRGLVSFDLERLDIDTSGDTVRVILPREIVELYESADDRAFEVIDTKGLGLFTSDRLTNDEDNIVKRRIYSRSLERLYKEGVIADARREAQGQLAKMLNRHYRRPVAVRDTTPRGTRPAAIPRN